jgi:hypothetical protein
LKKEYYLFGLLGIGALAVLYFLWRENAAATSTAIPEPAGAPQYPNAAPINLGDVNLTETAPPYLTANVPLDGYNMPTVAVQDNSGGGCCVDDCEAAGIPVTVQTIPKSVLDAGFENLKSYAAKVQPPVSAQEKFGVNTNTGPSTGGTLAA